MIKKNGTTSNWKAFAEQRKSSTNKHPTEGEKIYVNDISDKELISKLYQYKELRQLNYKKKNLI